MKTKKRVTLKEIAKNIDLDIEEALIKLWDAGFDWIVEPNIVLYGKTLEKVKKILSLPNSRIIRSKTYWCNKLNLNDDEFDIILNKLGIKVNSKAKYLPKGGVASLIKELNKKHNLFNKSVDKSYEKANSSYNLGEKQIIQTISNFELKEVGHRREIRYLEFNLIEKIHFALVKDFKQQEDPIDPAGVRSNDLLKSALFRPHTSNGERLKYPTVEMAAAALVHSLIHNHPFYNGNKRTALVSLLVFLDENGRIITCNEAQLFKFILQVAQHRVGNSQIGDSADKEVYEISKWIINNSRWIEIGERTIPFRRLRQILNDYGCIFDQVSAGCNMQISREIEEKRFLANKKKILKTHIYFGGDGRDVSKGDISKIRKELKLSEEDGIDSFVFYNRAKTDVNDFIIKYRKTLKRLAGM